MTSKSAVRAALLACFAAGAAGACSGSDGVASPGEGVFVPSPPVAPPAAPPAAPPPPGPPAGPAAACPAGFLNAGVVANLRNCQLPALVTGTLNVPKLTGVVYSITSVVDVGQDRGADPAAPIAGTIAGTLSVDPGVTIFGSGGLDFIRVNRGSLISAAGTAADPIIFTSRADVEDASLADEAPGSQWGGLLILGRAPVSEGCPVGVNPPNAACTPQAEATNAVYGGNTPTDSSGRISFAVIKYPGFTVTTNKELNGLTLAGVGNGTLIENVQVHQSSDDGVEIFGGNVNVRNIVITGADDDGFDTDLGWRGTAQYLLAVQRTTGGDRGFEWSAYSSGVTPNVGADGKIVYRSQPRISNATVVMRSNAASSQAMVLNSGTEAFIHNSVFTRQGPSANTCVDIDDTVTITAGATFKSVFLSCGAAPFTEDTSVNAAATQAEFAKASNTNNTQAGASTLTARPGASTAFINGMNENNVPVAAAGTGATTTMANPVGFPFLTTPANIGAVHPGMLTWYQGWTCSPMIGEESC
ncbi:MAG: hypothetical protein SGJ21_14350 [Alphaproteobacteria bacterium]|nr:hypothetical protein [Alphaproteobacteria bacterium]